MKLNFFALILIFSLSPLFSFPPKNDFSEVKIHPESEIFFTQMENCYSLELLGIEPSKIQIELPEIPHETKFASYKKEEFAAKTGEKGTKISLWFLFERSGFSHLAPLLVKISGKNHYFEFEPVYVYENPALIEPKLEINFLPPTKISGKKNDFPQKINAKIGEKIVFEISIRYATQILGFDWKIPQNSIFTELERFEFANGREKITQFTTEGKKLARFEWKILQSGEFSLPEISVEAFSFNGEIKNLRLPKNISVLVENESRSDEKSVRAQNERIFASAFKNSEDSENANRKTALSREDCLKIASSEKRSFFDRIFSRRFAIFAGGEINSIPEEKFGGNSFSGGKKVKITEQTEAWAYIECEEFSGWTKNTNLIEIK